MKQKIKEKKEYFQPNRNNYYIAAIQCNSLHTDENTQYYTFINIYEYKKL